MIGRLVKKKMSAGSRGSTGRKKFCGWGFKRSEMESLKKSARRRMVDHKDYKAAASWRSLVDGRWLCQRTFLSAATARRTTAWAENCPAGCVAGRGPRLADPDRLDVAESSFFSFALPQLLQAGNVSDDVTSTSLILPHSVHRNSKIGMTF
jgi:hypothetical protein